MLRFIGPGRDYYDSVKYAGAYAGDDTAFLFNRSADTFDLPGTVFDIQFPALSFGNGRKFIPARSESFTHINGFEATTKRIAVFFCDTVYFGVQLSYSLDPYNSFSEGFWSAEAFESIVKCVAKEKLDVRAKFDGARYPLDMYFAPRRIPDAAQQKMVDDRTPIVVCEPQTNYYGKTTAGSGAVKNPATLSAINFYRAVDAFSAYQRLDQWFGSIAFPENPMIQISDKVKLEKRGFDSKISFRHRK